jgi:hypothetical protein
MTRGPAAAVAATQVRRLRHDRLARRATDKRARLTYLDPERTLTLHISL